MELNLTVTCKNCEMRVSMAEMKPAKDGAHLICLKCYKELYGLHDEKILQMADSSRTKYSCAYCGYKFARGKDLNIDNCPYCGKANLSKEGAPIVFINQFKTRKLSDY